MPPAPPHTPDGRYIIVRDRLWRAANPHLDDDRRVALVSELIAARRAVRSAQCAKNDDALRLARDKVDRAKHGLGERGAPWWEDGAPDLNRRLVRNTVYAQWWAERGAGH